MVAPVTAQISVAPSIFLLSKEQSNSRNAINGKKRSGIEIMARILVFCRTSKNKTRIIYANNLNYATWQKYSKFLISRGLLTLENRKYATTQKGFIFLEALSVINDLVSSGEAHASVWGWNLFSSSSTRLTYYVNNYSSNSPKNRWRNRQAK